MKRIEQQRTNRSSNISNDLKERVRLRAFEIYQQRGGGDGYELEDWLQAEAEVLENQRTNKAA